MERLFNLLTELTLDPFKQDEFLRDPAAGMAEAGLTSEEQALLSRWSSAGQGAAIAGCPWVRGACFSDPGPDPQPHPDPPM